MSKKTAKTPTEETLDNAEALAAAGEDPGGGKKAKKARPQEKEIWIAYKIVFITALLGSVPNFLSLWRRFLETGAEDANKAAQELSSHPAVVAAGGDVKAALNAEEKEKEMKSQFHRDPVTGLPILYEYYLLGMVKEWMRLQLERTGNMVAALGLSPWSYKRWIYSNIKCEPRRIAMHMPDKESLADVSRMVMCETMQGPRVSIKTSEAVKEHMWMTVKFKCMSEEAAEVVRQAMAAGKDRGLGEWRNAGWGRFICKEIDPALVSGDVDQGAVDILNEPV